jgi:lipopolysaccharide transport system permease protein
MNLILKIWQYRDFISNSVKREFQSRYRNTGLGVLWVILNPLAMMMVYLIIFSKMMHGQIGQSTSPYAYGIYLCSGILVWGYFSELMNRGLNLFLDNANLLKKIHFPRLCLPIIIFFNAIINFLIIFSLFTIFIAMTGNLLGWTYLLFVPILAIMTILGMGIGLLIGFMNIFFRDIGQLFGIFLQFWFWFTPIVYPAKILPQIIERWEVINPAFPLIQAVHSIVLTGQIDQVQTLYYPLILGVVLSMLALYLLKNYFSDLMDEL